MYFWMHDLQDGGDKHIYTHTCYQMFSRHITSYEFELCLN